jgi:peptidyl-prolyl cis-trans isomerase C
MDNEKKILAKVGHKEILQSDVNDLHRSVGPERILEFANPEGQKELLEELIAQELLLQDARNKKLDQSPEFLREVEKIQESVLKQIALKELLKSVEVSDDFVKNYYQENPLSFKEEEAWQASHILVNTAEESEKIYQEIQAGKSFAQAALEYSQCPSKNQGGNLGFFTAGKMVAEFENCVKEMTKGEIREGVESQFGWHLIQLTDKKEAGMIPFEQIKDELKKQLLLIHQEKAYIEKGQELKKTIPVEYYE